MMETRVRHTRETVAQTKAPYGNANSPSKSIYNLTHTTIALTLHYRYPPRPYFHSTPSLHHSHDSNLLPLYYVFWLPSAIALSPCKPSVFTVFLTSEIAFCNSL